MLETTSTVATSRVPKPKWLRVKLPTGEEYKKVRNIVSDHKLHTICRVVIAQIWVSVGEREQPLL